MNRAIIKTLAGDLLVTEKFNFADAADFKDRLSGLKYDAWVNLRNIVIRVADIKSIVVKDDEDLQKELEENGCTISPDGVVLPKGSELVTKLMQESNEEDDCK